VPGVDAPTRVPAVAVWARVTRCGGATGRSSGSRRRKVARGGGPPGGARGAPVGGCDGERSAAARARPAAGTAGEGERASQRGRPSPAQLCRQSRRRRCDPHVWAAWPARSGRRPPPTPTAWRRQWASRRQSERHRGVAGACAPSGVVGARTPAGAAPSPPTATANGPLLQARLWGAAAGAARVAAAACGNRRRRCGRGDGGPRAGRPPPAPVARPPNARTLASGRGRWRGEGRRTVAARGGWSLCVRRRRRRRCQSRRWHRRTHRALIVDGGVEGWADEASKDRMVDAAAVGENRWRHQPDSQRCRCGRVLGEAVHPTWSALCQPDASAKGQRVRQNSSPSAPQLRTPIHSRCAHAAPIQTDDCKQSYRCRDAASRKETQTQTTQHKYKPCSSPGDTAKPVYMSIPIMKSRGCDA